MLILYFVIGLGIASGHSDFGVSYRAQNFDKTVQNIDKELYLTHQREKRMVTKITLTDEPRDFVENIRRFQNENNGNRPSGYIGVIPDADTEDVSNKQRVKRFITGYFAPQNLTNKPNWGNLNITRNSITSNTNVTRFMHNGTRSSNGGVQVIYPGQPGYVAPASNTRRTVNNVTQSYVNPGNYNTSVKRPVYPNYNNINVRPANTNNFNVNPVRPGYMPYPGYPGYPAPNSVYPAPNTVNPGQSTFYPAPNNVYPARNNVNPAPTSVNPAPNTVNPGQSTFYPAPNNVYPARNNVNPAPNSVYPAPNTVNPGQSTFYPAPNNVYPAPNSVYPAPNTVYPAPNSVYPAPNTVNPGQNTFYPAPNSAHPFYPSPSSGFTYKNASQPANITGFARKPKPGFTIQPGARNNSNSFNNTGNGLNLNGNRSNNTASLANCKCNLPRAETTIIKKERTMDACFIACNDCPAGMKRSGFGMCVMDEDNKEDDEDDY